jgi:hypothetical protein
MADPKFDDANEELAAWLKEAGRRRATPSKGENVLVVSTAPARSPLVTNGKGLALLGLAAAAYLQYFFLDVYLQIVAMPTLIVFIAPPGAAA